jgi:hypothetical protein
MQYYARHSMPIPIPRRHLAHPRAAPSIRKSRKVCIAGALRQELLNLGANNERLDQIQFDVEVARARETHDSELLNTCVTAALRGFLPVLKDAVVGQLGRFKTVKDTEELKKSRAEIESLRKQTWELEDKLAVALLLNADDERRWLTPTPAQRTQTEIMYPEETRKALEFEQFVLEMLGPPTIY